MPALYDAPVSYNKDSVHKRIFRRIGAFTTDTIQTFPRTIAQIVTSSIPAATVDNVAPVLAPANSYITQSNSLAGVPGVLNQFYVNLMSEPDTTVRAAGLNLYAAMQTLPPSEQQILYSFFQNPTAFVATPSPTGGRSLAGQSASGAFESADVSKAIQDAGLGNIIRLGSMGNIEVNPDLANPSDIAAALKVNFPALAPHVEILSQDTFANFLHDWSTGIQQADVAALDSFVPKASDPLAPITGFFKYSAQPFITVGDAYDLLGNKTKNIPLVGAYVRGQNKLVGSIVRSGERGINDITAPTSRLVAQHVFRLQPGTQAYNNVVGDLQGLQTMFILHSASEFAGALRAGAAAPVEVTAGRLGVTPASLTTEGGGVVADLKAGLPGVVEDVKTNITAKTTATDAQGNIISPGLKSGNLLRPSTYTDPILQRIALDIIGKHPAEWLTSSRGLRFVQTAATVAQDAEAAGKDPAVALQQHFGTQSVTASLARVFADNVESDMLFHDLMDQFESKARPLAEAKARLAEVNAKIDANYDPAAIRTSVEAQINKELTLDNPDTVVSKLRAAQTLRGQGIELGNGVRMLVKEDGKIYYSIESDGKIVGYRIVHADGRVDMVVDKHSGED